MWCGLTENVHPALWQAVHAGFDGVLVTYVQLFELQSSAQGPTCCLDQRLALTQVPHGGIDCNKQNPLKLWRECRIKEASLL